MRFYGIKNMYMNGIHTGIQCGHVMGELFNKYGQPSTPGQLRGTTKTLHDMLWDWSKNHKTWVLLDGGYASNLRRIAEIFKNYEEEFPWAEFHEEQDALDGALTAIGIILPEFIYDAKIDRSETRFTQYVHRAAKSVEERTLDPSTWYDETYFRHGEKYFDLIQAVSPLRLAS
jgi:hypothetical protein